MSKLHCIVPNKKDVNVLMRKRIKCEKKGIIIDTDFRKGLALMSQINDIISIMEDKYHNRDLAITLICKSYAKPVLAIFCSFALKTLFK